jgi:transcriptional regulator with XRE-family HTH domain
MVNMTVNYWKIGRKLKQYRESDGHSLSEAARLLGEDKSYLSRVETGNKRPSGNLIKKIITVYGISDVEKILLYNLIEKIIGKEVNLKKFMASNKIDSPADKVNNVVGQTANQLQIEVPQGLNALYSDLVSITSNPHGYILDFAQTVGPTNRCIVVSRIGMSEQHALALYNALRERLKASMKIGGETN